MKYIDADRLCAEIEKVYKSEIRPWLSGVSATSAIYDYILPLIDSLQQEQPEVDLEEEISRTYHNGSVADTSDMDHVDYENIARHFYELGCRRTAEKYDEIEYNRQRAEESVPNDLEEAAESFTFKSLDEVVLYGCTLSGRRACFIAGAKWQENKDQETIKLAEDHAFLAGAEWQKEQDLAEMAQSKSPLSVAYANRCFENGKQAMKEQMMKEAVDAIVEDWNPDPKPEITIPLNPEEFTCGDKVRVIVLKKED